MKQVSSGICTGYLKPKYRTISTFLGEGFIPKKGLDVFIDFNTFISALSSYQKYMNNLPFTEHADVDIISSFLYTYKHWKDYTRKWDNVRIIGYINDFKMEGLAESSQLKSYMIPYTNKFSQERFKQITYYWDEAVKVVEKILKYIPGMYLIKCNRFDSYVIPNLLEDYEQTNTHRIIVSGNPLMTSYQYLPNTTIIYSRFNHNGLSQLSDPFMIVQSITKINEDVLDTFTRNNVFYNILNAIVGDFERGLIGIPQASITSIAYGLIRAIEKREIPEDPKSIESVLPAIDKSYHSYLKQSYPLVDIQTHTEMIPQSQFEKVKSQMIDLYDVDSLNAIMIDGLNLLELL